MNVAQVVPMTYMKGLWMNVVTFVLLFAGAIGLQASTYTCTQVTVGYDPQDPTQKVVEFAVGTELEVSETPGSHGFISVVYKTPEGNLNTVLCKPGDVGREAVGGAPVTSGKEAPKSVSDSSSASKPGEKATWYVDFADAKKFAKDENKMLLMDFTGSDWCGWCIKLDREVFSTSEFSEYAAKNLVLLKLDFPKKSQLPEALQKQNQSLAQEYDIEGFPTVIVLNSQAKKIATLGYQAGGPKAYIDTLEKVKAQNSSK
jgi:protein disulfide-isomerase